jgi:ABC-2 type transport system ATP-binding protein
MYGWMSGYEYLDFVANIFGYKTDYITKKIAELLDLVDLKEAQKKHISTYSGGMKQRLGIAQALLNDPEVIILDEPVSALDPIGRKEVLEVIERLKSNRTVLFSTHILSDVDRICDDVIIINEGKLVVAGPLADLKTKYASPILEVEFASDPRAVSVLLRKQPWAKKIEQNGNRVRIWLTSTDVVESNMPIRFLVQQSLGILKYGLTLPETEDVFVGLLGEGKQ